MKIIDILKRMVANSDATAQSLKQMDQKLNELIAASANEADLLNRKFEQVVAGLDNQSDLLNRKFEQVVAGLDNQSRLLNRKFEQVIASLSNQSDLLDRELGRVIEETFHQSATGNGVVQVPEAMQTPLAKASEQTLHEAMQQMPLLIAERTYNTSHPDYDASEVRNFPGHIFNYEKQSQNTALRELARFARGGEVPDRAWFAVLAEMLAEAASVPHAAQVFERRSYVEQYLTELGRKHRAHYVPGWVNLDDALFLYWLVRQIKPKTIVQCGVCNGLSAAFMMLGLVKNGPEGKLHAIDLPPIFDPRDPAWRVEGNVYGVVIPDGKTSGWLVPDAYRDRFEILNGDAKELLPEMVDNLDSIDFFYHDSDHTYDHMMFEFRQAKRKLNKGGLVVGDDVSWNASLWDFADEFDVPSYNFKGAVGVAFF